MIRVLLLLGRPQDEAVVTALVAELRLRCAQVDILPGDRELPDDYTVAGLPVRRDASFLEAWLTGPGRKIFIDPIGPGAGNRFGSQVAQLMFRFGLPVMNLEGLSTLSTEDAASLNAARAERYAKRLPTTAERPETAPDGRPLAADLGYERYVRLMGLAGEITRDLADGYSLLDIGGEDAALQRFVPGARYEAYSGFITRATPAPQPDGAYDVVVAADVLEHVDPAERPFFLQELLRVARRRVVFSFPQPAAATHEAFLLTMLPGHRWLEEHRDCGLPDPVIVDAALAGAGASWRVVPNHSLASWSYAVLFDHQPMDEQARVDTNLFLQLENFPRENVGECYRLIYVVDKE
ncbi:MAG: class I SAM-dependent methyltransferase [bacterium]|nr:class I SAM-dependent methyltransferase [bacterium]